MVDSEIWWDTRVASAKNLGEFMFWFSKQPEEAQKLHLNRVYIVFHRSMPGAEPEPVRFKLRDGTTVAMQERKCSHGEDCARCKAEAGGYKFCWIGPWTRDDSANKPEPSVASASQS